MLNEDDYGLRNDGGIEQLDPVHIYAERGGDPIPNAMINYVPHMDDEDFDMPVIPQYNFIFLN